MTDSGSIETIEISDTRHDHHAEEAGKVINLAARRHRTFSEDKQHAHFANTDSDKVIVLADRREAQVREALSEHEEPIAQIIDFSEQSAPDVDSDTTPHSVEAASEEKELKSRLSRALTKLGKGAHDCFVGKEIEQRPDHHYTQEELLQLVKEAEAEIAERKAKEHKMLYPLAEESGISIDIGALANSAAQLNKDILESDTSLSEILDKEKKGEKVKKQEFVALWRDRAKFTDSLNAIEKQQKVYANKMAEKATLGLVQRLFAPFHRLMIKAWISLNATNPVDSALGKLRSAYYMETREFRPVGKDGKVKRQSLLEVFRVERASPAALAAQITLHQNDAAQEDGTSKLAVDDKFAA